MNAKASHICDTNDDEHCRQTCPLAAACVMQAGDDSQILADRMDKAAELVGIEGWN